MISAEIVTQILAEMKKMPALNIYGGDWLRDPVSGCSLAAQGFWFRQMLAMHDARPYGHLVGGNGQPLTPTQVARQCGCTPTEARKLLKELEAVGVPGRTGDRAYGEILRADIEGEEVDLSPISIDRTGVIYSRRMLRDQRLRIIRFLVNPKGLSRLEDLMHQPPYQTGDQTPERDARAHGEAEDDNETSSSVLVGAGKEATSRARTLTPQQDAVRQVVEALEKETDDFRLPTGGRIARWIAEFGLPRILDVIRENGPPGTLDNKGPNFFHAILKDRKRNGKRTSGGGGKGSEPGSERLTRQVERITSLADLDRTE